MFWFFIIMSSGFDCKWTFETLETLGSYWPWRRGGPYLFCVGFRIQNAFKPVTLNGLDKHFFFKEKRRVTGRCSAGMYKLIEIPPAVIHYKAKTNIWYICVFVHLTLVILLCWRHFNTKKKYIYMKSNSFWVSSSGYELSVHDWACATAGSLHKCCTFPTGLGDALHLFNNCSDMSADVEPAAVALQ